MGRDGRLGHGGRMGGCMGIHRTVQTVQSQGILYNPLGHKGLMGLMGSLMANLDMTDRRLRLFPSKLQEYTPPPFSRLSTQYHIDSLLTGTCFLSLDTSRTSLRLNTAEYKVR